MGIPSNTISKGRLKSAPVLGIFEVAVDGHVLAVFEEAVLGLISGKISVAICVSRSSQLGKVPGTIWTRLLQRTRARVLWRSKTFTQSVSPPDTVSQNPTEFSPEISDAEEWRRGSAKRSSPRNRSGALRLFSSVEN